MFSSSQSMDSIGLFIHNPTIVYLCTYSMYETESAKLFQNNPSRDWCIHTLVQHIKQNLLLKHIDIYVTPIHKASISVKCVTFFELDE